MKISDRLLTQPLLNDDPQCHQHLYARTINSHMVGILGAYAQANIDPISNDELVPGFDEEGTHMQTELTILQGASRGLLVASRALILNRDYINEIDVRCVPEQPVAGYGRLGYGLGRQTLPDRLYRVGTDNMDSLTGVIFQAIREKRFKAVERRTALEMPSNL